jgi:hypothetical protein
MRPRELVDKALRGAIVDDVTSASKVMPRPKQSIRDMASWDKRLDPKP